MTRPQDVLFMEGVGRSLEAQVRALVLDGRAGAAPPSGRPARSTERRALLRELRRLNSVRRAARRALPVVRDLAQLEGRR